jgi:hypothetical protein
MKWISLGVLYLVAAMVAATAAAQDRVARAPSGAVQATRAAAGPAQAAIERAAAANKYTFLFFWKEQNPQTDAVWNELQPAIGRLADTAECVSVQTTSPTEKAVVDRYGVSRAPMPLILAIAPNGAITKAFPGKFEERELASAFVSPCTQRCLKALQDRRLVFLCVRDWPPEARTVAIPQGISDFKADSRFAQATEIVLLNVRDQRESGLLRELQIDSRAAAPVTVFLAPPGTTIGKFGETVTKIELAAKLAAAQSGPCAGGKCGPNGCGPKNQ